MKAEQFTGVLSYHGEGAVWWQATGEVRFVDMLAGVVVAVDADAVSYRMPVGSKVAACLRPRLGGGAVLARENDIAICRREDLSDLVTLTGTIIDVGQRFNEGNCDPDGRFYAGTMAYDRTPGVAALYRVGQGTRAVPAIDSVTTSNGLGFSPDGTLAYYNDTATGRTAVYDYGIRTGLTNPRTFVAYPAKTDRPDGLCVDAEGGVWVAMFRGGVVRRFLPTGELDAVIEVPVRLVTSCAFGGENLETLFITTSRENLTDPEDSAGAVFRASVGIRGMQPLPFRY